MKTLIYNKDNLLNEDINSLSIRVKALIINKDKLIIGNEDGIYQFIGGHVEDNEDYISALKREIKELSSKLNIGVNEDIFIITSYLSKGLEFDAVIIEDIKDFNKSNILDMKLLYVSMTRALHELVVPGGFCEEIL